MSDEEEEELTFTVKSDEEGNVEEIEYDEEEWEDAPVDPEDLQIPTPNLNLPNFQAQLEPLQSVAEDMQRMQEAINLDFVNQIAKDLQIAQAGLNLDHLAQMAEDMQRMMAGINFEQLEQMMEFVEEISEARDALIEAIENFEPPEEYEPEELDIDEEAVELAFRDIRLFKDELKEVEAERSNYAERIERAIDSYENGEVHEPIFLFMSVQDGLMQWICEEKDHIEAEGDHYYFRHKKKGVTEDYSEVWGFSSDEFKEQLEDYLDHRHYIMHGNPKAVFDENIAKISILFLMLTISAVNEQLYRGENNDTDSEN